VTPVVQELQVVQEVVWMEEHLALVLQLLSAGLILARYFSIQTVARTTGMESHSE
jgi:hypothetical protein